MKGSRPGVRPSGSGAVALTCQEIGGNAPPGRIPVVILHGLFGSGGNWRTIARGLDARVLLPDARNHGGSPHTASMTYDEQAADVAALLARYGIARAALVGHSMGGKTAMRFAARFPQRVAGLVAVDIAPVDYPDSDEHRALIAAMRALPLAELSDRRAADAALASRVPDPPLRAFLLHSLAREGPGFRWRLGLKGIAAALGDLRGYPAAGDHPPFSGPALFLVGGDSDYAGAEHRGEIERDFPAAALRVIEGAGHWLHAEQPDMILGALRDFLAGLE